MGRKLPVRLVLLLLALSFESARAHVWGDCVLPPIGEHGDNSTEFYFYVNTNHPAPIDAWELQVSGPTSVFAGPVNSSLALSNPNAALCIGPQPYWYAFGPFVLSVGDYAYQFLRIGYGDGFVTAGPEVVQGGGFL